MCNGTRNRVKICAQSAKNVGSLFQIQFYHVLDSLILLPAEKNKKQRNFLINGKVITSSLQQSLPSSVSLFGIKFEPPERAVPLEFSHPTLPSKAPLGDGDICVL